eukprot:jgi/Galph1/3527/GphlegSOOS_G2188.1
MKNNTIFKHIRIYSRFFSTKNIQETFEIVVEEEDHNIRLDRFLRRKIGNFPQSLLERMIRKKIISLDDKVVDKAGNRVLSSSVVRVPVELQQASLCSVKQNIVSLPEAIVERVHSWILYKDSKVIVLNKPPNLACQGGSELGDKHLGTLLSALCFDRKETPRLVHRLDKEVSGTLLLARDVQTAGNLSNLFRTRQIRKRYWALVTGNPLPSEGEIRKPIEGQMAITRYRVVEKLHSVACWMELEPVTGRKRQLRLHCTQVLGCPILFSMDSKSQQLLSLLGEAQGIHLHAYSITFPNMEADKSNSPLLTIQAPLPCHMEKSWSLLGFQQKHKIGKIH